ncbi:uncharacterized protein YdiU (UPF0061 family) [Roseibium hamelinense]|uniref:Protein nucleotidyltransferase YdiU n=1 Tax=Roseibium hamelinense TaxID=150831 RepID=A0A562SMT6_9HYPH|nr:YdiU family protein [Roseibium hamelinense]MTI44992.1 YdiU family protein [Roseibium hamelinense]TWI82254.1 uncharacterized protein YdiU (UPF0061 family) [Roseibium hamelinense]
MAHSEDWLAQIPFENSYAQLPERFFERRRPDPVRNPSLIKVNSALACFLGLRPEDLASPSGVSVLAGSRLPETADPIAMAYAGHQFGGFVPQLGDGRAVLLGEVRGQDDRLYDVQLKGSGRTAFSRMGDGRAGIGPVLREYIVSEAMFALGVPTTRSLAAVRTGQTVLRERPIPGAILTRVSRGHIRVGTFQYFAAQGDIEALQTLREYVVGRLYPDAIDAENAAVALLEKVVERQAQLISHWMLIGFIHGVMNTDNMSVAGETIDYGPCAFMEAYEPGKVYSSIDQMGRYAYGNQPAIGHWNLVQLAQSLLPLFDPDMERAVSIAQDVIDRYPDQFEDYLTRGLRKKLGLLEEEPGDRSLAQALLDEMAKHGADFTNTFRDLSLVGNAADMARASTGSLFADPLAATEWLDRYRARLSQEGTSHAERANMLAQVNPVYIPRNHLIEEAISAAEAGPDLRPFEKLVEVLAMPFEHRSGLERYALPAKPEEQVLQTYCGT